MISINTPKSDNGDRVQLTCQGKIQKLSEPASTDSLRTKTRPNTDGNDHGRKGGHQDPATRRAEPDLTRPGLTQTGLNDGSITQSGGDNSVTAPIHGAPDTCGPRIRTGIVGRTSLSSMVGSFLGFSTHSFRTSALLTSSLIALARWRTKIASQPLLLQSQLRTPDVVGAGNWTPTFSKFSYARPCQTLFLPPVDFAPQPNHQLLLLIPP
ncbi:hypothetical protein FHETE_10199 [Fusarium heterosporum]|uniref:Uncharacterized protein n=1 Tax=Fusarium heterosporum TaxID=42747 RepID=A0A8H5SVD8_FUSHE|nr:hypothetical protein FHETE_10199 [Fusarium heterosporum]